MRRPSPLPRSWRLLLTVALLGSPSAAAQVAGPLTLQEALDALNQSPGVQQAQLSVQAAQATFNAAQVSRGLTVTALASTEYSGPYTTTKAGSRVGVDSSLSGLAGVNVSVGVFPWASSQAGLRRAEWALRYAQARLIAARNAAKLNVMQGYFSGVLATRDVQVADQSLAVARRQLAILQAQQANGNATPQAVLSAQASVQVAQAAQVQAVSSVQQAHLSLGAALGRSLGEVQFTDTPAETLTLPDVESLVRQARAGHPDVIYAMQQLSGAEDALETARINAAVPDVTASVNYGPAAGIGLGASLNLQQGTVGATYRHPIAANLGTTNHLSASLNASAVLYSPSLRAEVMAAQANVGQARVSLSVAQQTAELNVRSAYSTLQNALSAAQLQAAQVQVAQAALDAAKMSVQAGTGTADAVGSAELSLAQAQRALLSARITAQLNLLQLMITSGGLS